MKQNVTVGTAVVALYVLATLVAIAVFIVGCGFREPCYQTAGISPSTGTALVFDACRGEFAVKSMPKPPASPTTTLPKQEL